MTGLPLITGATGFAGSHLLDHLIAVAGGHASSSSPIIAAWSNPRGVPVREPRPQVRWRAVDLLDRDAVVAAIADLRPSVVYHCAGAADVGGSWVDPVTPLKVNALGTLHVIDGIREAGLSCTIVVIGSAAVYRPSRDAASEESPIGPSSPYGLSKLAQEMIAARAASARVMLARPFNHAGPRQSPAYVTSGFARQIAEIEAGAMAPVISVGNLDARRDITDVRDVVRAYRMLAERGQPARPYNICSGRAQRIGDLLESMLALAKTKVSVTIDAARLRPSDNPVVLGDPRRIAAEVGWRAEIPIDRTLADLLDYWRMRTAVPRA
ncbi:MAG TPA: GDP-mannose 4,6-dehydratase [Vicinamibacterales bacterium]|nr:GDP-mannose 4,6-dehydratase [Vicinamibacterales bacterium]